VVDEVVVVVMAAVAMPPMATVLIPAFVAVAVAAEKLAHRAKDSLHLLVAKG